MSVIERRINANNDIKQDRDSEVEEAYRLLQYTRLSDDQIKLIEKIYSNFKKANNDRSFTQHITTPFHDRFIGE